jgi:hydrogenase maturation protease
VVLFGYGNPSRGDDALGPLLLDRAVAWLRDHPDLRVTPVADFQLQIEHAEDLRDQALALFLDADAACPPPCAFRRVYPARDSSYTTHELSPGAVLHVYERITGASAPPAFVLGIRGAAFELGEPLSAAAEAHLAAAWSLLEVLLGNPSCEAWTALLPAVE